ncbi:TonB-dependent siderophore receptor [Acinetobacter sp. HY1485]|uniref:TonB-dependent siderophore receptor n=1 Tax=Acinetobacter sp. HY1485 TaxID=2970918 RepID=UPI0022B94403|nr:TonB-dependent siderophore receptor [Acinetobacter sp. HY1485]
MTQNKFIRCALSISILLICNFVHADDHVLDTLSFKSQNRYIANTNTVASKLPVILKETPQSVSVLTEQRIEDQHLTSVEDALEQVAGLTVIPNDSTQSQYKTRGYALNSSVDGIPSYNSLSGNQQFDLALYQQIEILRGASGILTGTGNLGGTVNFVTKKPKDAPEILSNLSYGSWNNKRATIDISQPITDKINGRMVAVGQDKDFDTDQTHQKKGLLYGVLEYRPTDSDSFLISNALQTTKTDSPSFGLPASKTGKLLNIKRATNATPDWAYSNSTMNDTVLGYEHLFNTRWKLNTRVRYYTRTEHALDSYVTSAVDTNTGLVSYAPLENNKYHYTRKAVDLYLSGSFDLFNHEHQMVIGYNYDNLSYKNWWADDGTTYQNIDLFTHQLKQPNLDYDNASQKKTTQTGLYSQIRFKLTDPMTLVLGGRVSNYKNKSRDIAPSTVTNWKTQGEEDGEFTPYAGLLYNITPQLTVYGSYSNIFVPQTALDIQGNVLAPRQGNQYEIGAKHSFINDHLNTSIALFRLNDENRPMSDPSDPKAYIASGKVQSEGIETELVGSLKDNWNISLGYTYATNTYLKDSRNQGLTMSTAEPKHSFKLWNMYTLENGLKLGLGATAVSEYYGSRGTQLTRKQGGYVLINTVVSYPINPNITVSLVGNNLTDKRYYSSVGTNSVYNIYGDPRNFMLSFNFKH